MSFGSRNEFWLFMMFWFGFCEVGERTDFVESSRVSCLTTKTHIFEEWKLNFFGMQFYYYYVIEREGVPQGNTLKHDRKTEFWVNCRSA